MCLIKHRSVSIYHLDSLKYVLAFIGFAAEVLHPGSLIRILERNFPFLESMKVGIGVRILANGLGFKCKVGQSTTFTHEAVPRVTLIKSCSLVGAVYLVGV